MFELIMTSTTMKDIFSCDEEKKKTFRCLLSDNYDYILPSLNHLVKEKVS